MSLALWKAGTTVRRYEEKIMPVRRLARSLLASTFLVGGADVLRNPEPRVRKAKALLVPLGVPEQYVSPLTLADGAVKVAAGLALATGRVPRIAALALAASMLPTTFAGHRFWEHEEPQARANHRMHFLKNLGIIGGLVFVALDTEGRESVPHRAVRALPWT
ncbi:MAG TPA: DoxX family protein [Streptosporangiales bacterium]